MNWHNFSLSDRFARYFFTLVVGNNIFGLFLTLSMYKQGGLPFFWLLFLVLSVAYPTALVCLLAIDVVDWSARRFYPHIPSSSLIMIATVAVVLLPALYLGFYISTYLASLFHLSWRTNFLDIARPGILFGALVTILSIVFAQWLKNMKAQYEQRAALIDAERRLVQARFDLFAKELHPHLLFNVIQNVTSLMTRDVHAAKVMLEELAIYYQEVLLVIDKNAISLGEELSLCRHFMTLQQSRYPRLSFAIDDQTKKRIGEFSLPPLLLQPLLENAVKYAISDDDQHQKEIRLTVSEHAAQLHIAIDNPHRKGREKSVPGFSKGLKNCENRMKDFFGEHARLALLHEANVTRVQLDLPYAH